MAKRPSQAKSTKSRTSNPRPGKGGGSSAASGQTSAAQPREYILTRNGVEEMRSHRVKALQGVAAGFSQPGDRWEIQPATKAPGEALVILRMDHGQHPWTEITPDVA